MSPREPVTLVSVTFPRHTYQGRFSAERLSLAHLWPGVESAFSGDLNLTLRLGARHVSGLRVRSRGPVPCRLIGLHYPEWHTPTRAAGQSALHYGCMRAIALPENMTGTAEYGMVHKQPDRVTVNTVASGLVTKDTRQPQGPTLHCDSCREPCLERLSLAHLWPGDEVSAFVGILTRTPQNWGLFVQCPLPVYNSLAPE